MYRNLQHDMRNLKSQIHPGGWDYETIKSFHLVHCSSQLINNLKWYKALCDKWQEYGNDTINNIEHS